MTWDAPALDETRTLWPCRRRAATHVGADGASASGMLQVLCRVQPHGVAPGLGWATTSFLDHLLCIAGTDGEGPLGPTQVESQADTDTFTASAAFAEQLQRALRMAGPGMQGGGQQGHPSELQQLHQRVAMLEAALAESEQTHELRQGVMILTCCLACSAKLIHAHLWLQESVHSCSQKRSG